MESVTGMKGWRLVRHVPAGSNWHPAKDHLEGTEVYGNPECHDEPWSVPFGEFDEFLFATGDLSKWLVATKAAVTGEYYENEYRTIIASSCSAEPYQVRWYNRPEVSEDPWVSLEDHHTAISGNNLLYGGASFDWESHITSVRDFGGANVYVRKIEEIKQVCFDFDGRQRSTPRL